MVGLTKYSKKSKKSLSMVTKSKKKIQKFEIGQFDMGVLSITTLKNWRITDLMYVKMKVNNKK